MSRFHVVYDVSNGPFVLDADGNPTDTPISGTEVPFTPEEEAAADAVLAGLAVSPDQVEAEASRRISVLSADAVMKLQVLGTPIPDSVKTAAQGLEAKSTALKAMSPIPYDYTNDAYWQES